MKQGLLCREGNILNKEARSEYEDEKTVISVRDFNAWYGNKQVLYDINMDIKENSITAFIGPSGCGKTTFIRSINRMNDIISSFKSTGVICMDGIELTSNRTDPINIRRKIGMVFQSPNPFPMSVYNNLKLPIQENFKKISNEKINEIIMQKLKDVALYDEIEKRLKNSALKISGGQQQRLCIARALALNPEVILFDEPCSALDPVATFKIEDLLMELKQKYSIVIVTHNIEQACRIADQVAFFYQGQVIEQGPIEKIFTVPETELLKNYLSGKF